MRPLAALALLLALAGVAGVRLGRGRAALLDPGRRRTATGLEPERAGADALDDPQRRAVVLRRQSPTATRTSRPADPRWRFFTDDRTRWTSAWFAGEHRVMIPFGCTPAPYYDPDPGCSDGRGFHHGVDVAIPCGVPLRAGHPALVLDHAALGPAYGTNPVLLRVGGQDVVIGHTTRVYVEPGDRLARGDVFARVGDSGAPDGCHLHFEVRPADGDYTTAVDPLPLLGLQS